MTQQCRIRLTNFNNCRLFEIHNPNVDWIISKFVFFFTFIWKHCKIWEYFQDSSFYLVLLCIFSSEKTANYNRKNYKLNDHMFLCRSNISKSFYSAHYKSQSIAIINTVLWWNYRSVFRNSPLINLIAVSRSQNAS